MKYEIFGADGVSLSFTESVLGDITYITVKMTTPAPEIPKEFFVEWLEPVCENHSYWGPLLGPVRHIAPDWGARVSDSRTASGAPVQAVISNESKNRTTVAISDPKIPTKISMGVDEKKAAMRYKVHFFIKPTTPIDSYEATIRIDRRDIHYCDAVRDACEWWETECGYEAADVPDCALMPMDSLWYSFHQDLDFDRVLEECRLSKQFGLDTVIIDDGWQTTDNGGGYAYCGDWLPIGLPRIKELVDEIHKLDLKVILWFSVPFLGIYSDSFDKFKDYTLYSFFDDKVYVLDPRYKAVRDYLKGFYSKAVGEWGFDGLKLDFIDSFCLGNDEGKPTHLRDFESLEDGVEALMADVKKELVALNPDVMVEFRQSYIGPAIRKYGNMLRVGDCPCDALANRRAIIDLRLTSGKTAVHSDMLMWNVCDTVESVSIQLASILFGVPQISVHLDCITEEQKKALSFYMSFWREHRDVLLFGKLYADAPGTLYSKAYSEKDGEAVCVCYEDPTVSGSWDSLTAVNCTGGTHLYFDGYGGKSYKVVNCMGEALSEGTLSSLEKIAVPRGGMVFVKN
ncbi:MAG: alpha-galactosidase [Clostridia bacterium]|nr:alpha-galactosidase [Clostridia bacterium]